MQLGVRLVRTGEPPNAVGSERRILRGQAAVNLPGQRRGFAAAASPQAGEAPHRTRSAMTHPAADISQPHLETPAHSAAHSRAPRRTAGQAPLRPPRGPLRPRQAPESRRGPPGLHGKLAKVLGIKPLEAPAQL